MLWSTPAAWETRTQDDYRRVLVKAQHDSLVTNISVSWICFCCSTQDRHSAHSEAGKRQLPLLADPQNTTEDRCLRESGRKGGQVSMKTVKGLSDLQGLELTYLLWKPTVRFWTRVPREQLVRWRPLPCRLSSSRPACRDLRTQSECPHRISGNTTHSARLSPAPPERRCL